MTTCNCKDCREISANPQKDGWFYVIFRPKPGYQGSGPGWWCPTCADDVQNYCIFHGITRGIKVVQHTH